MQFKASCQQFYNCLLRWGTRFLSCTTQSPVTLSMLDWHQQWRVQPLSPGQVTVRMMTIISMRMKTRLPSSKTKRHCPTIITLFLLFFYAGLCTQPYGRPCPCVVLPKMGPIFNCAQPEWLLLLSTNPPVVVYQLHSAVEGWEYDKEVPLIEDEVEVCLIPSASLCPGQGRPPLRSKGERMTAVLLVVSTVNIFSSALRG